MGKQIWKREGMGRPVEYIVMGRRKGINSKDRPILQRWWPGDRGEELVKKWTKL